MKNMNFFKTGAFVLTLSLTLPSLAVPALAQEETGFVYEDDDIRLGQYKGLTYSTVKEEITEEKVDAEVDSYLQYYSSYEQITEGTAQEGDLVNIDYAGTVDGEAFDGGTSQDAELTIGEGAYLEDFENGIIGMTPGETKDVEVAFPEDYHSEEMAGKNAVFAITLNYICGDEIVPELTEEFLQENLGEYDSIDAFRESIRQELEEDSQETFESEVQEELLSKIMENTEVLADVSAGVAKDVDEVVEMYKSYAEMYGMEFEDFLTELGMEEETLRSEVEEEAQAYEEQRFTVEKIADLEGIEVTDEVFDEYLTQMAEEYGYESKDELKEYLDESEETEEIRRQYLAELVTAFLVENATYEEAEETEEVLEEDLDLDDEFLDFGEDDEDAEELVLDLDEDDTWDLDEDEDLDWEQDDEDEEKE